MQLKNHLYSHKDYNQQTHKLVMQYNSKRNKLSNNKNLNKKNNNNQVSTFCQIQQELQKNKRNLYNLFKVDILHYSQIERSVSHFWKTLNQGNRMNS